MNLFEYIDGRLHCEATPVHDLAARYGTPLYIYSAGTLVAHYRRFQAAFARLDPLICFAVKSCSNIHILRLLAEAGCGFDVVSGGELYRTRTAGAEPARIVFAGVGKTEREIDEALAAGVGMLNVESESEMELLAEVAKRRSVIPDVALRIIPEVDPRTHAYTATGTQENKFGVTIERAADLFRRFGRSPTMRLRGVHLHIGSSVHDPKVFALAIRRALGLIDALRGEGFRVDTLDAGGGFGAHYKGAEAPAARDYAREIVPLLVSWGLRTVLEPGRSIAANAGVLVTRVLHVKSSRKRRFVVADAAMNDLIRPALYDAYHFIWPVDAGTRIPADWSPRQPFDGLLLSDVVGPICESGDFLAKNRPLPPVRAGDLLAVFTSGAYAMSMASQYNSRPRAAEILVEGAQARVIRRRETYQDLITAEESE